jgi:transcriptional regulator with XRE-family HTH domain
MMREWLISIRKMKGMSQKAAAEAAGVSQPTYWEYEHGISTPTPAIAKRIGAALGFDWTLFYEDAHTA